MYTSKPLVHLSALKKSPQNVTIPNIIQTICIIAKTKLTFAKSEGLKSDRHEHWHIHIKNMFNPSIIQRVTLSTIIHIPNDIGGNNMMFVVQEAF